jgi:hypothetical protein
MDASFFADASAVFLSGVLSDPGRGSCASIPVLVVAVGRRLGYPLRLVSTKGHLFARWDGGESGEPGESRERFNIEAAGRGVNFFGDEHYRRWPFPVSDREVAEEGYLESFGAAEELAMCLELRGYCLYASGRRREAAEALGAALRLRPQSRNLRRLVERATAAETGADGGGRA